MNLVVKLERGRGIGSSTAGEQLPCDRGVVGSDPVKRWALFLLYSNSSVSLIRSFLDVIHYLLSFMKNMLGWAKNKVGKRN